MKQSKGIDKRLDDAWSLLVKLKAGNRCEVYNCGKSKYLNAHHIFTRRNKAVRWSLDNGIALCPSHHTLDSRFSAHGTPIKFTDFLRKYRGENNIDLLTYKSNQIHKWHVFEKELLLKELLKEIKTYETKT